MQSSSSACGHEWSYYILHPVDLGECLGAQFNAWIQGIIDSMKGWFLGVPADTPCLQNVSLWECFVWAVRARLLRYSAAAERVGGAFLAAGGGAVALYSAYHMSTQGFGATNASGVLLGGGAAALGYYMYTQAQSHSVLPAPCRPTATVYEAIFQMPLDVATHCMLASTTPAAQSGDVLSSLLAPCGGGGFNGPDVFAIGCEPWVLNGTDRTFTFVASYAPFMSCKANPQPVFQVRIVYNADQKTLIASNTLDNSSGPVQQPWALDLPAPPPKGSTCCVVVSQQSYSGISLWFGTVPSAGQWPHVFVPTIDTLINAGDNVAWDTTAGYGGGGGLRVAFANCAAQTEGGWMEKGQYSTFVYGDTAAVAAALDAGFSIGIPFKLPAPKNASPTYLYGAAQRGAPSMQQIEKRIRAGLPKWSDALYSVQVGAGAGCGNYCNTNYNNDQNSLVYPCVTPVTTLAPASAVSGGIFCLPGLIDPPSGVLNLPILTENGSATVTYVGPVLIGGLYNAMAPNGDMFNNSGFGQNPWSQAGTLWVPLPPPWNSAGGSMDLVPYGSAFYPPWLPLPVITMQVANGPQNVDQWPGANGVPGQKPYQTNKIDSGTWRTLFWITWTPPQGGSLPTGMPGVTISSPVTAAFYFSNGAPVAFASSVGPGKEDPKYGWPVTFTFGNAVTRPSNNGASLADQCLYYNQATVMYGGVFMNQGGVYMSMTEPGPAMPYFQSFGYGDGVQPDGSILSAFPTIVFAQTPSTSSSGP